MANLLENDVKITIGQQNYLCTVEWRNGVFLIDEPKSMNGQELGPDPYTTLLAALGSCTISTLRMYIDRKGWNIPEISIYLNLSQESNPDLTTTIRTRLAFGTTVTDEQRNKLLVIAGKCPVARLLENKIIVTTTA